MLDAHPGAMRGLPASENLAPDPVENTRTYRHFHRLGVSGKAVEGAETCPEFVGALYRGRSAKKAWPPATRGLRGWRRAMPGRDVELFEALAGDLLSELGYERSARSSSPEIEDVAERRRTWWEGNRSRKREQRGQAARNRGA